MKKYNVVAVHRDNGLVKGFTLEAESPKAALRAAKLEIRRGGDLGVSFKYLVTEA